ncbi:MAG: FAD-dependent oxidoreductase [Novosphingobium sp.]|nr:FAD-dependent oxidoreductase [Novosphingobium sp.]
MSFTHDLIVIGGGAAGLTAAGGAALFGLKVALIEADRMGGECLNTGCVPSKALIAAAARAHQGRQDDCFGVTLGPPQVAWEGVSAHIREAIAAIEPHDSQERFEAMGVEVIRSWAEFISKDRIRAGTRELRAPRIVIATGSKPAIPQIAGIDEIKFLTNENLFELDELPDHLVIIGAGAIGVEMAQAFRRLGSEVTVIGRGQPLGRDDRDAADILTRSLADEGVRMMRNEAESVSRTETGIAVVCNDGQRVSGSHLLVAAGRTANVTGLALDIAGVESGKKGIPVDRRRRTSNRRIYAIGDCREGPRFTHAAGYEGSLVAVEVALGLAQKVNWSALPHCTFTHPELAQIGLTESQARESYGSKVKVIREDFGDNDRAIAEGEANGFLKLVMKGRKVLGVTVIGTHAGDLLLPWAQIIGGKASTFALGSAIVAYPTRGEISKAASFAVWEPVLFGTWPKRWAALVAGTRRLLG